MNEQQNTKKVIVVSPAAIKNNGAFTTVIVDTLGYDYCVIDVTIGATDVAMAALKLTECDTSGGSYTDVSGADFDGDTDIDGNTDALPTALEDDGVFSIEVDLRSRKRYLDLSATAGNGSTGTYLAALATLGRGKVTPTSASDRGCTSILRV